MSGDGVERPGDRRDSGGDPPGAAEQSSGGPDESAGDGESDARDDLAAQVELLAAENQRLRDEYVRARRATHRRTALGLFAVGLLAVAGAVAFPDARNVLLALGGTGLFGAVLTYSLTPKRFVAAGTGERVYAALAATGRELVGELGLREDRVYAPARIADESFADVRLFVPQRADYAVPDPETLDSTFVVEEGVDRGVALPPTGAALYREFETAMAGEISSDPTSLAAQLADALVEGFEIADATRADVSPEDGRVTVAAEGSVYGPVDGFDHPVASFLAVGLAANLDRPVRAEATAAEEGPADYFVTCEWDPATGNRDESAADDRESPTAENRSDSAAGA